MNNDIKYVVLVNQEEQYSIWPAFKSIPTGWTQVHSADSKTECLALIEKLWTDMRPLSLRGQMAGDNIST
jgi:MbtH protein